MHFRSSLLTALFGLFLCLAFLYFYLFRIDDTVEEKYRSIMRQTNSLKKQEVNSYTAHQHHEKVTKHIFYENEGQALQLKLNSKETDLAVEHRGEINEIIEKMKGVTGIFQEKLLYDQPEGKQVQLLHLLEAETANYFYRSKRLISENVIFKSYKAPGHQLVESVNSLPFTLSGKANILDIHFEGDKIELTALQPYLEHEFGTISANSLVALKDPSQDQFKGRWLGDVMIKSQNRGSLACQVADIDLQQGVGHFYNQDHSLVVYNYSNENPKKQDITITSKKMALKTSEKAINQLTAYEDVTIVCGDQWVAKGDHVFYDNNELGDTLLTLKANPNSKCHLTTSDDNQLDATAVFITPQKRQAIFFDVTGRLSSHANSTNGFEPVLYTCKQLTWEDEKGLLTLVDDVKVTEAKHGTIVTDGVLRVFKEVDDTKGSLKRLESEGNTVLNLRDNQGKVHCITCFGKAVIDHENLQTTLTSPKDPYGMVPKNQQVFFHDDLGEIYADTLMIDYVIHEGNPIIKELRLHGDVKIYNHSELDAEKNKVYFEYALADAIIYTPDNQEINLTTSGKGRRVLFFDKINNLQVSAPALTLKRDQKTQQDSIQGKGDVRFNFAKHEWEEIRKQFQNL